MHTYRTHFRAGGHGTVGGCVDDPGYLGAGGLGVYLGLTLGLVATVQLAGAQMTRGILVQEVSGWDFFVGVLSRVH